MRVWSLHEAKNKFSAVVAAALQWKPQRVTRHGKQAVVVVAAEEFERLTLLSRAESPSFVEFLLSVPDGDEMFERLKVEPREVEG